MKFHFHPAIQLEEERFGNAILTHFPMCLVKADVLQISLRHHALENRRALWVGVNIGGIDIQFMNTHLDVMAHQRRVQVELASDHLPLIATLRVVA